MEKEITIPEEIQNICREMAAVAKKNKLFSFSARIKARTNWGGDISISWEAGRHEEDEDEIKITSQFFVHTTIKTIPTP